MPERSSDAPLGKHVPGLLPLSADQAAAVFSQCLDLTFHVAHDLTIVDVQSNGAFPADVTENWIGRSFADLVAEDSQAKVDALLDDNAAGSDGEGRWRHLNLRLNGGLDLPLLLKHFCFRNGDGRFHLIVARDLRQMAEAQTQWQSVQRHLERDLEEASIHNNEVDDATNAAFSPARQVGKMPMKDVVLLALNQVELLCIEEALKRCDGDRERAAEMLGISVASLERRTKQ